MSKKFEGYSYSWTQPYYGWQTPQQQILEQELDRLDAIDMLVDNMDRYRDAEEILNKILKND